MSMTAAQINNHLNALLANGRIEVGLEVGADPGLPASQYIQVPAVMKVGLANGSTPADISDTASVAGSSKPKTPSTGKGPKTDGKADKDPSGSRDGKWVMYHEGKAYKAITSNDVTFTKGERLAGAKANVPASWETEIRAFVAANAGNVRADEFDELTVMKVHAIRYWAVKAGFVLTSKSSEYNEVPTPDKTALDAVSREVVEFIADYSGQALTACVARGASWRKTNHATGGGPEGIATGLPRRWMSKEGMWVVDSDRTKAANANKRFTSAFYVATHAVSVHSVLAFLVPGDSHHFAVFRADYGFIDSWDVRESARMRLAPRSQVAGTAMVTDAVEVVKMLITEGYTPFLTHAGALQALHARHEVVVNNGMRTAVYANWFFSGHPDPAQVTPVAFNQKDAGTSALVGELGVVATKFYHGSTIAASPALANAASQLAIASDVTKWAQLARFKSGAASLNVLKAFGRVSGASSGANLDRMASADQQVVVDAANAYAAQVEAHANLYGVATFAKPSADQVWGNAAPADARADEVAKLAA